MSRPAPIGPLSFKRRGKIVLRRHQPKLILFALTLLFFAPVLKPVEAQAVGGLDMRALFYPWLEWVRGQILSGQSPFWDAAHFGGYPFLSNPQVAIFYPPTWLMLIFRPNLGFTLYLILHVWLAGVGMYLFVWESLSQQPTPPNALGEDQLPIWWHDAREWGGLIAAVGWMFSGFVAARIFAGHIGLLATHVWLGLLLWGTLCTLRNWSVWKAILLGVPFGMAILAGHTTSLLYVGMVWGLYAVYLIFDLSFPRRRDAILTTFGTLVIAGVVGLLLSGVQLVPLVEFAGLAGRSAETTFDFASRFSFPPEHLITLFIPAFFGEPAQIGYWGAENFAELTVYAGVLPLLALLLAIGSRLPQRWFWIGIIALGILLGVGHYGFLFEIFYDYVPGFRLARAPARAMVLYTFGSCVLFGLIAGSQTVKTLRIVILALLLCGASGIYLIIGRDNGEIGRYIYQHNGWLVAAAFAVLGGILFILSQRAADKSQPSSRNGSLRAVYALLFTALLFADLWTFGAKLIRRESIVPSGTWFVANDLIYDHQRILPWGISIFEQNGAAQVGLDSVFGYNALEVGTATKLFRVATDPRSRVYDLFGADYLVAENEQRQFTDGEDGLILHGEAGGVWVYNRPNSLPLARLVPNAILIPDEDQAIATILAPDFDPRTTATVSELPCSVAGAGSTTIAERRNGYWRIETASEQPSLLVVSEMAYPGWHAYVDGERVAWQSAYTAFRSVCVPAGEHVVEWRFVPLSFVWGGILTLFGLGLVTVAWRREAHKLYQSAMEPL